MNGDIENLEVAEAARGGLVLPAASDVSIGRGRTSWCTCCSGFLRRNLLVILLLLSLILGVGVGFCLKYAAGLTFTKKEVDYIAFPGTLFLNMLQMVIVPLVVSSLVAGISSLDKKVSGVLGLKALVYCFVTTFLAVVVGILMVLILQPGNRQSADIDRSGNTVYVNTADAILDLLRNMVPPNIVEACFRSYKTDQIPVLGAATMDTTAQPEMMFESVGGYKDRSNVLGLVVFSCALGVVLGRMGPEGEPLRAFSNSLMETIIRLVRCIIWISPIGIFFLILGKILAMDDWVTVFGQIGLYSATVIAGLLIHGLIVLPLLFLVFARRNPFTFLKGLSPALFTAFVTSSSSATLPLTINCLEQNNRIDKRVTRFMLPIGATVNNDGTALFQAVAAIFIAQVNGLELDAATVITVSVMATLTSIGAGGVPQTGLVTLVIVLNAVGLPAEDVTLIIVIDWFLDRVRTIVNVASDSFGAGIAHYSSQARLAATESSEIHCNEAFPQSDPDVFPKAQRIQHQTVNLGLTPSAPSVEDDSAPASKVRVTGGNLQATNSVGSLQEDITFIF